MDSGVLRELVEAQAPTPGESAPGGQDDDEMLDPDQTGWAGPVNGQAGQGQICLATCPVVEQLVHGDVVCIGRPFIANPDLPERLRHGWDLAAIADRRTCSVAAPTAPPPVPSTA